VVNSARSRDVKASGKTMRYEGYNLPAPVLRWWAHGNNSMQQKRLEQFALLCNSTSGLFSRKAVMGRSRLHNFRGIDATVLWRN
jgi:hypothetical protein